MSRFECMSRCVPLYKHLLDPATSASTTSASTTTTTTTAYYYYKTEEIDPYPADMGLPPLAEEEGGKNPVLDFDRMIDKEIEARLRGFYT